MWESLTSAVLCMCFSYLEIPNLVSSETICHHWSKYVHSPLSNDSVILRCNENAVKWRGLKHLSICYGWVEETLTLNVLQSQITSLSITCIDATLAQKIPNLPHLALKHLKITGLNAFSVYGRNLLMQTVLSFKNTLESFETDLPFNFTSVQTLSKLKSLVLNQPSFVMFKQFEMFDSTLPPPWSFPESLTKLHVQQQYYSWDNYQENSLPNVKDIAIPVLTYASAFWRSIGAEVRIADLTLFNPHARTLNFILKYLPKLNYLTLRRDEATQEPTDTLPAFQVSSILTKLSLYNFEQNQSFFDQLNNFHQQKPTLIVIVNYFDSELSCLAVYVIL
jgi:hypothetical protein